MARYHFAATDQLPQELLDDFQLAQSLPADVFKKIVQAARQIMTGETELSTIESITEQLSPLAQDAGVPTLKLMNVVRSLIMLLQGSIKRNLKLETLIEDCETLGLDDERVKYVCGTWKKYYVAISKGVLSQTLSVNPLKDLDWRFGVTASSSELSSVGRTFLQLKLTLDQGDGLKDVFVELTLNQFYDLLHQLESAKQTLDFFTS
ncbi:hypothetical protein AKO1_013283 [Acrasis kona]|uniref:COMM domain-containing protein n=1 Tax=Acrasis kona TaxID=1008807 RepID=A0AAW2YYM5_9EUKA